MWMNLLKMNNLSRVLKKEFYIYLATLIILILLAHSDILSDPSARFNLMAEKENYTHPFIYSFAIYFIIFIIRKLIDLISKLFSK